VQHYYFAAGTLPGQGAQRGGGGGAADACGREDHRCVALVQGDVAVGVGELEYVADLDVAVEYGGDFAAVVELGGEHAAVGGVDVGGERVLADLAQAVGQLDLDADELAGAGGRDRGVVRRLKNERHGAGTGRVLLHDLPRHPHLVIGLLCVEALFNLDQGVGHQPVDLGPGFGDLGGDHIGQLFGDGFEEVLVDDVVLVFGDAQRGVLVGDAAEHGLGDQVRVGGQGGGEGGDGAGQGLLLLSVALVGAAEKPVQEFRMRREQAAVKVRCNAPQPLAHQGEGGFNDGAGFLREHRYSLGQKVVDASKVAFQMPV
jgi:hypothetical protein